MVQSPSWEANWSSAFKKYLAFDGNRSFIIAFTNHLSLFWAITYPHPTSWRSIVILFSYRCFGFPSGFFPSVSPINTLYAPVLASKCALFQAHPILLHLITRIISGEGYRYKPPPYVVFYTFIFLIPLALLYLPEHHKTNTLSLYSSLNMRGQFSQPYKTTGNVIVLKVVILCSKKRHDKIGEQSLPWNAASGIDVHLQLRTLVFLGVLGNLKAICSTSALKYHHALISFSLIIYGILYVPKLILYLCVRTLHTF
jgi:hypothetical protein